MKADAEDPFDDAVVRDEAEEVAEEMDDLEENPAFFLINTLSLCPLNSAVTLQFIADSPNSTIRSKCPADSSSYLSARICKAPFRLSARLEKSNNEQESQEACSLVCNSEMLRRK